MLVQPSLDRGILPYLHHKRGTRDVDYLHGKGEYAMLTATVKGRSMLVNQQQHADTHTRMPNAAKRTL